MDDLERQLNSILSDPKQMEQIAGLARSLMGDGAKSNPAPDPEPATALLGRIASLMPGESRTISIEWKAEDARGCNPIVEITGMNISKTTVQL